MVKKIGVEKIEEIKKLFLDVFSNEPWKDEWISDEQVTSYVLDIIDNNNSLAIGYYLDTKLVGLCLGTTFNWWQGKEIFIKEFCIDRSLQGKGFGKLFLKELESLLKKDGIEAVTLATDRTFPAYDFYIRNGYQEQKDTAFFVKLLN